MPGRQDHFPGEGKDENFTYPQNTAFGPSYLQCSLPSYTCVSQREGESFLS
jgi:hypothetical protein